MRALQTISGLVLFLIGLLLLGFTSGIILTTPYDLVGIALILSGLLFWIPGLVWRKPVPWLTSLFIPGALAFAIGGILLYIGRVSIAAWIYLWTVPISAMGLAFVAMYLLGPHVRWLRFVGILVTGIGIGLFALGLTVAAESTARIIGPIILIGLGLWLAISTIKRKQTA